MSARSDSEILTDQTDWSRAPHGRPRVSSPVCELSGGALEYRILLHCAIGPRARPEQICSLRRARDAPRVPRGAPTTIVTTTWALGATIEVPYVWNAERGAAVLTTRPNSLILIKARYPVQAASGPHNHGPKASRKANQSSNGTTLALYDV